MNERFRLIVLGAGFSRAAGYPLAPELWREIRLRARRYEGRAAALERDVENYLRYRLECDGLSISDDEVNLEELCEFLDIEHFLGLRGSDTWSIDGNEGTVVIKTLLGQILAEFTPARASIPELYLEFARRLGPGDVILTFNYDTLLELSLTAVGKPFRLFPSRYTSVHGAYAEVDPSLDEVVVLKLHGSIDWFDRHEYSILERQRRDLGLSSRATHPVFGPDGDELGLERLVEGPRFPGDPLVDTYRVLDVPRLYQRAWMFLAAPVLLAPSGMKILYASKLQQFWDGLGRAGIVNLGLAIIGYSLPQQDRYARQVMHALVTNYQSMYWGEEVAGGVKDPLILIDRRITADEIDELELTYRFVNWDRCITHFNGFDSAALDLIFRGD
jgi:hypothetical protein